MPQHQEVTDAPPRFRPPVPRFFSQPAVRLVVIALLCASVGAILLLAGVYRHYAALVDRRLATGAFSDTIDVFSAPRTVAVGDALTPREAEAYLRRSGFTTRQGNPLGWFNLRAGTIEIFPGKDAFSGANPGMLEFAGGKISRIVSLEDHTERRQLNLPPQLIANISGSREKRWMVHFSDIPPTLVNAVISAEDKHFFQHSGFDMFRIIKAAWVDLKDGRKQQGASTLSMQLVRGLWLDPEKSWKRKAEELLMTVHLEHKLTKQQIFEDYANQVYLGRKGTFSINGFGEGARALLGKDISQLDSAEAALLAGLVQRPSYYNPFRYPGRARERRDVVLGLMRQNGFLTGAEYSRAVNSPVVVAPEQSEGVESQYFLDLVSDEIERGLDDHEEHTAYIYTTLDPDLQRAAEQAVRSGMESVDRRLRGRKRRQAIRPGEPQAALVAIDPHTGDIKALVGGRSYGASQFNHALAMRQPGSVFKPFVYAAALDTAIHGDQQIFTPASIVDDSPTTFEFGREIYEPGNFGQEFMGEVTLRTALEHSLNNAAVSVAEQVGYGKVVSLAHRAGLNEAIQPTPSVALGAYETTPLEMAGAYTIFANRGVRVTPTAISLVRGRRGDVLYQGRGEPAAVLDPRVAYLVVNMMQDVLRSGTGAGVRSLGFTLPAAGKTGTSRDGWFAGFTGRLLAVVWVGFDDDRELGLEGAHSALPIWTEFMKRAAKLKPYSQAGDFEQPPGIVTVEICPESGQLAGARCPDPRPDVFIDGTQPVVECEMHSANPQRVAGQPVAPGALADSADRVANQR